MDDPYLKQLLEGVFPNFWIKFEVKSGELQPVDKAELAHFVTKATSVQSFLHFANWNGFLKKHEERMVSSPLTYVTYVLYICKFVVEESEDAYDRFLTVISMVGTIAAYFYTTKHKDFLSYTTKILLVFFSVKLQGDFYERGGWDRLGQYILDKGYLTFQDDAYILSKVPDQQKMAENVLKVALIAMAVGTGGYDVESLDDIQKKDVESDRFCQSLAKIVVGMS